MKGFGRYNLLCKLGEGGMGELHLARQKTLKRFCVLKLIHSNLAGDQKLSDRFLNEARAAALLSHPHLVSIYDCDCLDGQYFIVMEYVQGMNLGEIVRQVGPLPLPMALEWMYQAVDGLCYLHQKSVIHRDIKPENMIVDIEAKLKIMDFGLAKHHWEGDSMLTATGVVMGSPPYMSPEQINETRDVDGRTDTYSLGIVLYQILTGSLPYHQSTAAAMMMAHLNDPMPAVRDLRPDVPDSIQILLDGMTQKDPLDRKPSDQELLQQLDALRTQYPWDNSCNDVWSCLDMESRSVSQVLVREQIDSKIMDSNLSSPTLTPTVETKERRSVNPLLSVLLILVLGLHIYDYLFKPGRAPLKASDVPMPDSLIKSGARSAPSAPSGGLYVKSEPQGATVLFRADEKKAPASFSNIPVGKYTVKIYREGFQDEDHVVTILENQFANLSVQLKPIEHPAEEKTQPREPVVVPAPPVQTQKEEPFSPLGKSADEIVGEWGDPAGRMGLGEDEQWMYPQGTVVVHEGKVVQFHPGLRSTGDSAPTGHFQRPHPISGDQHALENQKAILARLEDDQYQLKRELDNALEKRKLEMDKLNARRGQNDPLSDYNQEMRQLDQSLGLPRIRERLQELEQEIQVQKERIRQFQNRN